MSIEVYIWLVVLAILDLLTYNKYNKAPTGMFETISFAFLVSLLIMGNIITIVTVLM
jgi:hypothetical protein